MFKMLNAFFAMFTSLFNAGGNLAQAAENTTAWARDESAFFNEKSMLERDQKIVAMRASNAAQLKELGIEEDVQKLKK